MLPVQWILLESIAKENVKSRLFNGANYVIIACTVTEIEVLKGRPFIPECHNYIGFIATSALKQSKSFELA